MHGSFIIPTYPFEKRRHPASERIREKAEIWIDNYHILSDKQRQRFKSAEFENLACCFFPTADEALLEIIARYTVWIFIFDDVYGPMPLPALESICSRALAILEGGSLITGDEELLAELGVIRDGLMAYTTASWMTRFIADQDLYFQAIQEDAKYSYKEEVIYPTVQEYILLKEKIVSAYPVIDCLELVLGSILPFELTGHAFILRIRQLANYLIGWYNDILGWRKELADHEAMNLLLVIRHEYDCSFEEAHDRAVRMHNAVLDEFVGYGRNIPDMGVNQKMAADYYFHLSLMIQGHALWYERTKRYPGSPDVDI